MITFYPCNLAMWREVFTFNNITLSVNNIQSKTFYNRAEFIDFLKQHKVRLDDSEYPLKLDGPYEHHKFGSCVYTVIQCDVIGWIKDEMIG